MQSITVLGTGFGALSSVRELRKNGYSGEIKIISPRAELHYYPSLIWIPSGVRTGDDIRVDLSAFFKRMNVTFIKAAVTGLSTNARTVYTDNDAQSEVENDGLIIASGGRFIKKLKGIEHVITPCEGIDAAETIRDRLKSMTGGNIVIGFGGNPKEPAAVRGGPMFEFLFGIDEQLRREGRRDKFTMTFFNPKKEPGKRLGDKAVAGILARMAKKGIKTHLGYKPVEFTASKVITEGGEIPADMTLFMPGMTGPRWLENTSLPLSDGGLVVATSGCKVEGFDRLYVVGDTGSYTGPAWMPKQAHMADLQAEAAAKNLLAELAGAPANHTFKPELICIIDSLDAGVLVFRNAKRNLILPPMKPMHWAKRYFEWHYLRQYR